MQTQDEINQEIARLRNAAQSCLDAAELCHYDMMNGKGDIAKLMHEKKGYVAEAKIFEQRAKQLEDVTLGAKVSVTIHGEQFMGTVVGVNTSAPDWLLIKADEFDSERYFRRSSEYYKIELV